MTLTKEFGDRIELDGYYCSESAINQVYFMVDSVLVILAKKSEIKVLYTKDFNKGSVHAFEKGKQLGLHITESQHFKRAITETKVCELETGYKNDKIKKETSEPWPINFNNTMCQYRKNILMIGDSEIYQARLLSWTEFIDKLRYEDNKEWITILKVATDIYRGKIPGLALLPDTKKQREIVMKDYMERLIMSTL